MAEINHTFMSSESKTRGPAHFSAIFFVDVKPTRLGPTELTVGSTGVGRDRHRLWVPQSIVAIIDHISMFKESKRQDSDLF